MLLQKLTACPSGMDGTIITGLIASAFSLCLGLFVYFHNRQHSIHKAFLFFNICVALWNLQAFALYLTQLFKPESLILIHKLFSIPSYFVLFGSAWLIFSFAGMGKTTLYKNILLFYFLAGIVFTIISFFPGFSDSVSICPLKEGIGPLYFIFIGYLTLTTVFNLSVLHNLYKGSSSSRKKNQLKYALIGLITGLVAIGAYFATLIWTSLPKVYFILENVYLLFFAYAILKYKLMDIYVAWRYLLSYISYGVFISICFLIVAHLLGIFSTKAAFLIIAAVILSPLSYKYLIKYIKSLFFGSYTEQLARIKEDERIEYTSYKLAYSTIDSIYQTIPIDNISIFLFEKMYDKFHPIAEIGNPGLGSWQFPQETIDRNDALINYFETTHKHLIKDDFPELTEKENAASIFETFNRLHAALGMPIFIGNKLQGILLVGTKKGKNEYHEEDIIKLDQLTKILGMHLSHSMFMEERIVFSQKLAHDMRNLIHKGLLLTSQIADETDESKSSEKKKALFKQLTYLDNIMIQFYDMNSVLNKVQSRNYALSPVDISILWNDLAVSFIPSFESKQLSIRTELSCIPVVLGNAEDLTKVFHNLLDNSLKFVNQGYVKISADIKENNLLIKYEDTGIGISKERLNNIWEPFYKIDSNKTAGLGLTIIREIIEAHKGKIWVESEENRGTTFYFTLQLAP